MTRAIPIAGLCAVALLAGAGMAGASTLVIGNGEAKECSDAALGGKADSHAIMACTTALEVETLNFRDRARTYVNRGATLVGEDRFREGVEQIDKGLSLGVKDPEKAFFNRGLANEALGDLQAAYRDYSRAAELKPDWAAPKTELARFSVKRP